METPIRYNPKHKGIIVQSEYIDSGYHKEYNK